MAMHSFSTRIAARADKGRSPKQPQQRDEHEMARQHQQQQQQELQQRGDRNAIFDKEILVLRNSDEALRYPKRSVTDVDGRPKQLWEFSFYNSARVRRKRVLVVLSRTVYQMRIHPRSVTARWNKNILEKACCLHSSSMHVIF